MTTVSTNILEAVKREPPVPDCILPLLEDDKTHYVGVVEFNGRIITVEVLWAGPLQNGDREILVKALTLPWFGAENSSKARVGGASPVGFYETTRLFAKLNNFEAIGVVKAGVYYPRHLYDEAELALRQQEFVLEQEGE
jgi:hypothetical protein